MIWKDLPICPEIGCYTTLLWSNDLEAWWCPECGYMDFGDDDGYDPVPAI